MMGRRLKLAACAATILALGAVATAGAFRIQAGNIVVTGNGGFSPTALPKNVNAPIKLSGHGTLSTVNGALPPVLKTLTFEFDKHGSVQTQGLPVCTQRKLTNTTVPQARKTCPGAIVGKGEGKAIVQFPDSAPLPVSSPITIFNGPMRGRNPTVIAHAYTTVPVPTTFVVPITIEKINDGRYGYRTQADLPPIAGGNGVPVAGSLTIHKIWRYRGQTLSFVNARCADGRLQARGSFTFADGTRLSGTFFKPCTVRR